MSNCKVVRGLAVSAALAIVLPLTAPAEDHGVQQPPGHTARAHPAIAAQNLSEAQKAQLAAVVARLARTCAPLQMARDPLVAALRAMLQQREDSLQMQQQRLRKRRAEAVKQQPGGAPQGDASGHDSAHEKARLADVDGALATLTRARAKTRKDYAALIGALRSGDLPAAGSAAARRSLTAALGPFGSRISRRIGAGTYRRIRRSAEARALSCYNAHLEPLGLVSADGKQCRLQSLDSLGPQFFDARCSYAPEHR